MRAGIWARSVAINENLALGTMLPQLAWAAEKNYPVLVMNPNYNTDPKTKEKIPGNTTMAQHCTNVWKNFVEQAGFKDILIIAHSAGGKCLIEIQKQFPKTFYKQVAHVALTDSY